MNDLEFSEGGQLLGHALPMAEQIVDLKQQAKHLGIPAVYVNDNFGCWESNFHSQIEHCLYDGVRGQPIAEMLATAEDDFLVLKPKLSAIYSTTLDIALEYLRVEILILTGIADNN